MPESGVAPATGLEPDGSAMSARRIGEPGPSSEIREVPVKASSLISIWVLLKKLMWSERSRRKYRSQDSLAALSQRGKAILANALLCVVTKADLTVVFAGRELIEDLVPTRFNLLLFGRHLVETGDCRHVVSWLLCL